MASNITALASPLHPLVGATRQALTPRQHLHAHIDFAGTLAGAIADAAQLDQDEGDEGARTGRILDLSRALASHLEHATEAVAELPEGEA